VAEELLDRSQVGAAVEEMRRERVAERVRARAGGDPRPRGVAHDEAPHAADAEAPAVLVEEERRLAAALGQEGALAREVGLDRLDRRPTDRGEALLRALAADADAGVAVRLARQAVVVEARELRDAEARAVERLEDRAVALGKAVVGPRASRRRWTSGSPRQRGRARPRRGARTSLAGSCVARPARTRNR